jgi:hypothetical protein
MQIMANLGDVANLRYKSAQDATLIAQQSVGLATGFASFRNTDPVLLADLNGNGMVDPADATAAAQWAVDAITPTSSPIAIPDITGTPGDANSGADPRLYLPTINALPGQTVTVALRMDAIENVNLTSADLGVLFDASRFQLSNVRLSSSLSGFALAPNVDNIHGTLRASIFTGGLGQTFTQGADVPLLLLDVTVAKTAPAGSSALNLAEQVGGLHTGLNGGALTLQPGPTNAADDAGVDGLVTVLRPTATAALAKLTPKIAQSDIDGEAAVASAPAAVSSTALDQYWILEGRNQDGLYSEVQDHANATTDWSALAWAIQSVKKSPTVC